MQAGSVAQPSQRAKVRRTIDMPGDVADRLAQLAGSADPMSRVIGDALGVFAGLTPEQYREIRALADDQFGGSVPQAVLHLLFGEKRSTRRR